MSRDMTVRNEKLSQVLRYRWAIGAMILFFCVLFQLNGSSIGMWNGYVSDGTAAGPIIAGADRPIRSDEWCVFTPMALSQYYNNFGPESDILRGTETDVYMVYGQSVKDWSVIFRPFQLGYLFLSPAGGLSFYWCAKLIALLLVSFDFGLLLTGRRRYLSLAYAFMIAFAPVVQWWFSTNAFPDMLVYGQGLVLCLAGYLDTDRYTLRCIYAAGMAWLSCCYLLVIYPAWQVPFFYVFLFLGIALIAMKAPGMAFKASKDVPILFVPAMLAALSMYFVIVRSWDAISLVMHSVYPGARMETGGIGPSVLFRYVANAAFPYTDKNVPGNVCEMAAFYDMFPLGLLAAAPLIRKKKDGLLISIIAAAALLGIYVVIGFPPFLSKLTLLSNSQAERSAVALSYCNLLLLFRSISVWQDMEGDAATDERRRKGIICICIAACSAAVSSVLANELLYSEYFTFRVGIFCAAVLLVCAVCIISGSKAGYILLCAACIFMGATVNPLRAGLEDIRTEPLGKAIEQTAADDRTSKWIAVSDTWVMGNYPIMFGARTVNCTNTYMNTELWGILDPEKKYEDIYNRYAHMMVEISEKPVVEVSLLTPDQIRLRIGADRLPELGVRYVISDKDLSRIAGAGVTFEPVFTQDSGRYTIFQVKE